MSEEITEKKKELPKYTGVLQTNFRDPKTRKNLGRIYLWESRSANPRAPVLYGILETKYGKSSIALWIFSLKKKTEEKLF